MLLFFLREDFASEDPHLHPDHAICGAGFCHTIADIGPQGMQRHPSLPGTTRSGRSPLHRAAPSNALSLLVLPYGWRGSHSPSWRAERPPVAQAEGRRFQRRVARPGRDGVLRGYSDRLPRSVCWARSVFSFSISTPFFPITIPGRAV